MNNSQWMFPFDAWCVLKRLFHVILTIILLCCCIQSQLWLCAIDFENRYIRNLTLNSSHNSHTIFLRSRRFQMRNKFFLCNGSFQYYVTLSIILRYRRSGLQTAKVILLCRRSGIGADNNILRCRRSRHGDTILTIGRSTSYAEIFFCCGHG